MADSKISALTPATTPLAGTEVFPIVQSGVTKKVATLDVTGGVYVGKGASNIASNTVVGNLAGAAITTASNSVAIGNATSALLTTGIQNTAVGDQALYYSVTGNYNAAFGRATLALSTGSKNSGFGWNAGVNLTSGENNAFWGHNAQASAASVSNEYTYGDANVTKHRFVGGDIVIGTAGKGIDFSADSSAAGMTSELLDDYEEGTWTPTKTTGTAFTSASGRYTKIGNQVTTTFLIQFAVEANGNSAAMSGFPFSAIGASSEINGLAVGYQSASVQVGGSLSAATMYFRPIGTGSAGGATITQMSGALVTGTMVYTIL